MTLHRNETTSSGYVQQMCKTQTLQTIEVEKKHFHTLIQTDKPIYKLGDEVKFRVVVVDRDLKPYHMNNIEVKVSDPLNQIKFQFEELGGSYDEGLTEHFTLPSNSLIGTWKISVIVDNEEYQAFKEFSVQEFTLPQFSAHIKANNKHLLINDVLHLSFYAKYSLGNFVKGNAEVRIKSINNGQIIATRSFRNISGVQNIQFNIRDDLKATTTTKQDYEAELLFTEPESGVSNKAAVTFTVHANNNPKIQANHPEKFMPGLPFGLKVLVYDWKETMIKSSQDISIATKCYYV